MRLIDADALKDMMLQAYNDALPEFDMPWKKKMAHSVTLSFMADIDEAPTVDAVPVVRCKECKWWRGPIYGNRCSYHSGPNHTEFYDADEFCSRGERKGGDE